MGLPNPFTMTPPKSYLSWANTGWQVTPWWDWHRYCGGNMREWVWDESTFTFEYDGKFIYRSFEEHARHVLLEVGTGQTGGSIDEGNGT